MAENLTGIIIADYTGDVNAIMLKMPIMAIASDGIRDRLCSFSIAPRRSVTISFAALVV